jgi:O-antigen ligase
MGFISQAIPSIRSLSIEPNLFAIATAAVLCIFISVYLTWNKRGMLVSILLMSAALLLSYTRSAYIGIFVSVIIMAVVSKQWTVIFRVMFIGFAAAILLVLLIVFLPSDNTFKQAISYKLVSGIVDFSEGTSIPRVVALQESVKGFLHSPIIGNGIFSANNVFVNPYTGEVTGTAGPIGWLNGLFIQALHDTGILGVLAWVGFFFTLLRKNYVIFKRLPISFERSIVLGFIGGNFVILIGSQASSIVWIAFPFIFWAANLTYLRYCREKIKVLY